MSTRIVICVDFDDTDSLETAYRELYQGMMKTELPWESTDEWYCDNEKVCFGRDRRVVEPLCQQARMAVFKELNPDE